MRLLTCLAVASLALAACSPEADRNTAGPDIPPASETNPASKEGNAALPPLDPPGPGEAGGLPDDGTPVSEAPFSETGAQGAGQVVQSYYALLEQGRYGEAWRLWSDGGRSSGMDPAEFAAGFDRYREYHANIGAPGRIEGAAGSLYVEIPVQIYGRLRNGAPFDSLATVTLRRANDVPGSTPEQRRWRIARIEDRPVG